jgi:hypothetical protein
VAQQVQVVLIDDIDGGEAVETVTFALDGVSYEIDLNEKNAARLRDALAPFVGTGRRIAGRSGGAGRARRAQGQGRSGGNRTAEIREWARNNGHKVNDRGRIPAAVIEAFEKANG